MKQLHLHLLTIFLVFFTCSNSIGQTTQASITGIVLGTNSEPIKNAKVLIKNQSTGFNISTLSNFNGIFTFKELPLGGPYTVSVDAAPFGEQQRSGYSLNQGDVINIEIEMQSQTQNLEVVEIVGRGLKNKTANLGGATAVSSKLINALPVNGRNFTSLMDLSPLSSGGTISGQLASSTNYTLDGMNAKNPTSAGSTTSRSGAPYSISIEAVREFKVVTNQYDVAYGRSGGGTVSAVTKSGTNDLSGSMFVYNRADWLSSGYDIRGNRRKNNFSTTQYGFTLGGPIIKDKLHFFVAWDHQNDSRPLIIADVQSKADELRFNITGETLDNFVTIARNKYGVSSLPQYGTFDKKRNSDAAFARLDWQINDSNLLTVRNNFTYDNNKLGLQDNTTINLYESYGNDLNLDNSLLASLRTKVNSRFTNELKLQHLHTYQDSSPGDQLPSYNIPRAIVENVSSTIDGAVKTTNIEIGGHRFAQEKFTNNVFQIIDNLYFNTDKVKYTFGIDLMQTNSKSLYGSEVNGRFHFNSVANFDNLTPYRYYREVPLVNDPTVVSNILNAGIYGQLQTKIATGLDMTLGLRFDYSKYPTATFNKLVFDELNIRTDNELQSAIIQPRIQFTWDVKENHKNYLRFGGGIFASDLNNYAIINNLYFDGNHTATVDVRAPNIPVPNFSDYRNNYASIPTLDAFQLPTINYTGTNTKVPVVYKSNISFSHFFTDKFRAGIAGYATLARNNYTYVDRNMVNTPFFTLANEDNRGVYVPASTIPANGAGDWLQGRISNKIGRVLELVSEGKVNQFAMVVDATYRYFKEGEISFSYTLNDTKDNTSYNGNVANTATLVLPVKDNPRDLSKMSYSDNQFRHKVVLYGTLPTFYGFNVGIRYSGIGGTRYSLLSGGNTNGDFVSASNDLAYIFDKNSPNTPQNIKTGLQTILDNPNASQSIKDYINKYSGKIAERNGGINNFYGIVDVRISKKITLSKKQFLEFTTDIFNVANLLKKEWGVNKSLGTQSLYALGTPAAGTTAAIPGFDSSKQQYNYRVNNSGLPSLSGNPFQIQIGLKYAF
ncbi:TonB-dependent receptor [Flavobacterium faecale]|uniref:TonB-dependent receptor n=1 Tax=Flavobacterium faecale TaxID=1355330 RepID=A0A2S1LCT0_9FLAO|nr:carboxypeptidase regulatory-like domain-containing protein [Flavobacterium faecale]AWG21562.1 TonB-dependent receptor [Flavobacterium faecale]